MKLNIFKPATPEERKRYLQEQQSKHEHKMAMLAIELESTKEQVKLAQAKLEVSRAKAELKSLKSSGDSGWSKASDWLNNFLTEK